MLEFVFTIAISYSLYYLQYIRKYDKDGKFKNKKNKKKEEPKIPIEIELLIRKYRIDIKDLNYKALLKFVALAISIAIAIVVTLIIYIPVDKLVYKMIIGAVSSVPILLITYAIMGKYFKKKGLILENDKDK